jgi:hypothetical protein
MAPRSKRKQHRKRRGAGELDRLKKEMQASGVLGDKGLILQEASDQEKMSAVLLDFIAPYRELATTYDAYNRLVAVAIIAWNAAVFKAQGKPDLLQEAGMTIIPSGDKQARQDFLAIAQELMERKARYFSDNRRLIVSYRLSETKTDYHLSVASTLQR